MPEPKNLLLETYGDWASVDDDDPQLNDPDLSGGRVDWLHEQRNFLKEHFLEKGPALLEQVQPEHQKEFVDTHYAWSHKTKASTWAHMLFILEKLVKLYQESGIEVIRFFGKTAELCYVNYDRPGDRVSVSFDIGTKILNGLLNIPKHLRHAVLKTLDALVPCLLYPYFRGHALFDELPEILHWNFSEKTDAEVMEYFSRIKELVEKNPIGQLSMHRWMEDEIKKIAHSCNLHFAL